jgi:CheY-like chemotaxis protein
VPAGSDHHRVEFEVPSLSEAVALASELRVLAHARVQIRPTSERLLGRRWKVLLTIPSMADGGPVRVLVVGEAGTAAAALDAVERISPDALLVDVGLPDGCGFELARVLIRAQPELAVLLMSANDPPAANERLSDSGAQGFVLKSCLAAAPLERFWRAPSP